MIGKKKTSTILKKVFPKVKEDVEKRLESLEYLKNKYN